MCLFWVASNRRMFALHAQQWLRACISCQIVSSDFISGFADVSVDAMRGARTKVGQQNQQLLLPVFPFGSIAVSTILQQREQQDLYNTNNTPINTTKNTQHRQYGQSRYVPWRRSQPVRDRVELVEQARMSTFRDLNGSVPLRHRMRRLLSHLCKHAPGNAPAWYLDVLTGIGDDGLERSMAVSSFIADNG